MSTSRIYLIGTGVIAGTHADAIASLAGAEDIEVHGSDINPDALERFTAKYPHVVPHADTGSMLASPARPDDIVIVATWPNGHCPRTLQAIESGRHVLCEKPLAMNASEARTMARKAHEAGRLLGCCSTRFLGLAITDTLKASLAENRLGDLYHVHWYCLNARGRPGIEYQPETPWFLDRSIAAGGIIVDWAPYDFTLLNDILAPVAVDVLAAWTAAPQTHADLPPGTVMDVEFHGGASLLYHLPDGNRVPIAYERSSCMHGREQKAFEFHGTRGGIVLDWLGEDGLTTTLDRDGEPLSEQTPASQGALGPMEKPLHYFYQKVNRGDGLALVDEQAVFNFLCICAIYDCVATGRPQTVTKENLK